MTAVDYEFRQPITIRVAAGEHLSVHGQPVIGPAAVVHQTVTGTAP